MRKVLFFAAIVLFSFTKANGQFRVGFGLGYAIPSGDIADFTDGGISFGLEGAYAVTEKIDVGLLLQFDGLIGADIEGTETSAGAVAIGSYMANGRYYFTEEGFRPYFGLGLGLATVSQAGSEVSISAGGATVTATTADVNESGLGLRPALGFKYGVLHMNVAYLSAGKINDTSVADMSINLGLLFSFGG